MLFCSPYLRFPGGEGDKSIVASSGNMHLHEVLFPDLLSLFQRIINILLMVDEIIRG